MGLKLAEVFLDQGEVRALKLVGIFVDQCGSAICLGVLLNSSACTFYMFII